MNHSSVVSLILLGSTLAPVAWAQDDTKPRVPDKTVVLTFDDSAVSHATFVAPLLTEHGFGATFYITEGFKFTTDKNRYMTWAQIKLLHEAGFEIGNHTRAHKPVTKQTAEQIDTDAAHIESQCLKHGIPRPITFCYPGYATSKTAVEVLRDRGYRLARAGGARPFDPNQDEPLLAPQAFDSKPPATFEQFVKAIETARNGKAAILTFHGVPDKPHPWVTTTPEMFKRMLEHLKKEGYNVIAMRDLIKYLPE